MSARTARETVAPLSIPCPLADCSKPAGDPCFQYTEEHGSGIHSGRAEAANPAVEAQFDLLRAQAASDRLAAAAPDLLAALKAYAEWMTAHFDDVAEMFYRDTGMMAPGKSEPLEMNSGHTSEEKWAAWTPWLAARKAALNDAARAAILRAEGGK